MSVRLADVAKAIEARGIEARYEDRFATTSIEGVCQDSRLVEPGDLFLAWRGSAVDSHDFIGVAEEAGAAGALVERPVGGVELPQIVTDQGRRAAAVAAAFVMGNPTDGMKVVGVTGTNGKTTTALLLGAILAPDHRVGTMGTLGLVGPDGKVVPGTEGLTTPGPVAVAEWAAALKGEGVSALVLEASSHALDQFRLDGLLIDVAVFTNLTRDHLDYHGDFDAYLAAKARLLDLLTVSGAAVVNGDDPAWRALGLPDTALTYGIGTGGDLDLRALNVETTSRGCAFDLEVVDEEFGGPTSVRVELPLVGRFNVENALAAIGAALCLGVDVIAAARRLKTVPQIPGRMERIYDGEFTVLVDFAHTPDALTNMLATVRSDFTGRLIVLFGAGGDRDRTKRPEMARAVAAYADVAIITSDNPRTESPARIAEEVAAGIGSCECVTIVDRRAAIAFALDQAEAGDCIVLAGKGHETYQVVGTEKQPFDERAIVTELLSDRSNRSGGGS